MERKDSMKKCKFDISGMTCSSCQAHVEKAVKKLDGAENVNVNLLTNSMNVEFDEGILDEQKIIKAVEDAGYGATLNSSSNTALNNNKRSASGASGSENAQNDGTKKNILAMKKRLIISVCFLIPLMYISMHHMLFEWFGLPVPSFIKALFHGNENAITSAFTQFLLVLPIMYVNRNYFINGFKRLFKLSPNMDSLIAIGSTASVIYSIFSIFMIGIRIRTWK